MEIGVGVGVVIYSRENSSFHDVSCAATKKM
jgi:hypothetical protein